MRSRSLLIGFASLGAAVALAAQDNNARSTTSSTPSSSSTTRRTTTAKGPLPDPTILDGSAQPTEKKPDYGMLGQFEIPGDENSKSGKVGGQSAPGQKGGGQNGQQNGVQMQLPMPNLPSVGLNLPGQQKGGGAGAGGGGVGVMNDPTKNGGIGAGAPGIGIMNSGGGAAGEGTPNPISAGASGGDASAEGRQVSELKTDPANAGGGGGAGDPNVQKPSAVGIGDPAMQIKGVAGAPSVVGAVPAGSTQQMEKGVGGSGKGSSGDNGNRGVEKGRVVPAGL